MRSEQIERVRALAGSGWEIAEGPGVTGAVGTGVAVRRRWNVQGLVTGLDLVYPVDAEGDQWPPGEVLALRVQVAGLDLWFVIDLTGGGAEPQMVDPASGSDQARALDLVAELPEELDPSAVGAWLTRVAREFSVLRRADDGNWEVWPLDDPLLSDDPFAHPVEVPFVEDGVTWNDEPVWGRIRRVLSRVKSRKLLPGTVVMGGGLEYRWWAPRAQVDIGFVNDEVWIDLTARTFGKRKMRLRAACDDPAGADRMLRLLFGWLDRLDDHRLEWFAAELGTELPGSAANTGTEWVPLPAVPAPAEEPLSRARADELVAVLAEAGWTPVQVESGPILRSLAAMEASGPVRWRCEFVQTGVPYLPEALRVTVAEAGIGRTAPDHVDPGPDERLTEHLGSPVDLFVDVLGVHVPEVLARHRDATTPRLTAALAVLAAAGQAPAQRTPGVLGALGLVGGLMTLTPEAPYARSVSTMIGELQPRPARPVTEAVEALDGTAAGWLEVGFAAVARGWWPTALTAFEEAAGLGAALGDLWAGALLFHAYPARARAALRRAAEAGCQPASARSMEGKLELLEGNPAAAIAAFGQGTVEAPDNADIWLEYGLHLAKVGRTADAVAALGRSIGLSDTATSRWYRSYAHLLHGDRDAALSDLEVAATLDPDLIDDIHDDPDLAALHGEPRFEGLAADRTSRNTVTHSRLRELLVAAGWEENKGNLEFHDDGTGEFISVCPVSERGRFVVVAGFADFSVFLRIRLNGEAERLAAVLAGWPASWVDDDGFVDPDGFTAALATAFPGRIERSYSGADDGYLPLPLPPEPPST